MGGEGHGHLVYKYAWSIGNCVAWCNIPGLLSCRPLVAFKPLIEVKGFHVFRVAD